MGTEGFEPSHKKVTDFKSVVSTNSTMSPNFNIYNFIGGTQIRTEDKGFAIRCLTT